MPSPPLLLHVLSGLEIGGKERIAIDLARRGRAEGIDSQLLLFDTPFRDTSLDLDPGGIPTHYLPRRGGFDARFLLRLRRTIRERGVTCLHAHNETAIVYCALAGRLSRTLRHAARRPGRPSVCATYHTYPGHDSPRGRRLARLASRYVDSMAAVSEPLRDRLREAGWVHDAEVIWNGVDLDTFRPDGPRRSHWRATLGVRDDQRLVGHVGRFDTIKRQEDLVEAAALLAGAEDSPAFVLVGQGGELERIRGAVGMRGLSNVHFVPSVPDVAAFLRELDLFVLCSSYEAAPLALLEAMASACPIVTTAVGGVPDIVAADSALPAARLVSPANPRELAGAIGELLGSPAERAELGRRARERARGYSADRTWRRYAEIYGLASARPRDGEPRADDGARLASA